MIPFQFNLYSSPLLPAVINCFVFTSLCLWRFVKRKSQSDFFLAILLIFTGIKLSFWMLGFAGWYDRHDAYTSFMFYFPFNIYLLSGPVVYFYFKSLINTDFKLSIKEWPHLLLPVFFILMILGKLLLDYLLYYPFPNQANFQFGTRGPFAEADKSLTVTLLAFGSFFFYLLLVLKSFSTYRQYVRMNFSNTDVFDFSWLSNVLFALSAGIIILFGFRIWELFQGGMSYKVDWYSYLALAVLSYYVSINGYFIESKQLRQLQFTPVIRESLTDTPFEETVRVQLDALMLSEKPYYQPELSLVNLADMLHTNKSVVSRVINRYYEQNFNDYINHYRVNAVIVLLKQGRQRQLKLLALAYECGFNSKATFNRVFKKVTGLSPKAYIEQINKSQDII